MLLVVLGNNLLCCGLADQVRSSLGVGTVNRRKSVSKVDSFSG